MAVKRAILRPLRRSLGRLLAALDSPALPLRLAVIAVVLASPSLFAGLATEDFAQRDVVTHATSWSGPSLDLFGHDRAWTLADTLRRNQEFVLQGYFPWVSDPRFDASFFRPLASLTHRFDYRVFPNMPVLMHAQSLLWYGALVAAVTTLFRALAEPPIVAGLAALFYAVDDAHGQPIGWLINRNALMASLFSVLALGAYDRFRRGKNPVQAALVVLFFSAGLASAEFSLCAVGYFVAYALFVDDAPAPRRVLASLLFVVPVAAFLGLRVYLGHHTVGSGLYLDPLSDLGDYIAGAGERAVVLLLGLVGGPFSDGWSSLGSYERGLFVFLATAVVGSLGYLFVPGLVRDRRNRFWLAGLLLSLPPAVSTFPEDRLLLLAGVGAFPLVARIVVEAVMMGAETSSEQRLRRGAAMALVLVHGVVAPLLLPFRTFRMHRFQGDLDTAAASVRSALRGTSGAAVVYVNAPSFYFTGILAATEKTRGHPELPRTFTLTGTTKRVELARPTADTLEVRPKDGFFSIPFDRIHSGAKRRFRRGQELDFRGVNVTVTEIDANGEPLAARFSFALPLESPRYRFLVYRDGRFETFELPKVGERTSVGDG